MAAASTAKADGRTRHVTSLREAAKNSWYDTPAEVAGACAAFSSAGLLKLAGSLQGDYMCALTAGSARSSEQR